MQNLYAFTTFLFSFKNISWKWLHGWDFPRSFWQLNCTPLFITPFVTHEKHSKINFPTLIYKMTQICFLRNFPEWWQPSDYVGTSKLQILPQKYLEISRNFVRTMENSHRFTLTKWTQNPEKVNLKTVEKLLGILLAIAPPPSLAQPQLKTVASIPSWGTLVPGSKGSRVEFICKLLCKSS